VDRAAGPEADAAGSDPAVRRDGVELFGLIEIATSMIIRVFIPAASNRRDQTILEGSITSFHAFLRWVTS